MRDGAHICALVPSYNRPAEVRRCLEAIFAQTRAPTSIIVVDNGGRVHLSEALADIADPRLTILRIDPNVGAAGALNEGLKIARAFGAELVWMMDDDGHVPPDCLERMIAPIERGELDVTSALVLADDGSGDLFVPWEVDGALTYDTTRVLRDGYDLVNRHPSFWGFSLVRMDVLDRLGPFKTECLVWGEEVEYALRLKKAGVRWRVAPGAIGYHRRILSDTVRWGRFGTFVISPAERLHIYYRNQAHNTRRDKGALRGLARALLNGAFFLIKKHDPKLALRIWAYGLDGYFDLYRLAPSRASFRDFAATLERRGGFTETSRAG